MTSGGKRYPEKADLGAGRTGRSRRVLIVRVSPRPTPIANATVPYLRLVGARVWIGVGKLTLKAGLNPWGLLEGPPLAIDPPARRAFDQLLERAARDPSGLIEYELAWPKFVFLSYAVHARKLLLHGTTSPDLELLRPSPAFDHGARETSVVSATNDGISPLFYAALNRDEAGSLWNGSLHVRRGGCPHRYYFFFIGADPSDPRCWSDGTVYLLPKRPFHPTFIPNEWESPREVRPIARLAVGPEDFPFLADVRQLDPHRSPIGNLRGRRDEPT
jgi:hypothetical protein